MSDLLVIGGGPAGLASALYAARAGLDVTVWDKRTGTIDKACGEGLMPDGADVLSRLGVDLEAVEVHPFRGVRYVDGELVAEGRFPGKPGLGIRRTALHQALCRRAEAVGVELRWGCRVTGLTEGGFETAAGTIRGRFRVAADGRTSRIRRWTGLEGRPPRRRRFGVRRHYEIEPWTDHVEVHWSDDCEAYCTPVGDRSVGVAMLWSGGPARFDDLLDRFPILAKRLEGAPVTSRDRGAGPLAQRCRRVVLGTLFLVGDASGYLDALTGEGMALAFHQAEAVVDAIVAGRPSRYAVAHRRIGRYPNTVTRLLLEVERRPWLRRRVMRSLASDGRLMSRFLALKMAETGPDLWGANGLVRLSARALLGGA